MEGDAGAQPPLYRGVHLRPRMHLTSAPASAFLRALMGQQLRRRVKVKARKRYVKRKKLEAKEAATKAKPKAKAAKAKPAAS